MFFYPHAPHKVQYTSYLVQFLDFSQILLIPTTFIGPVIFAHASKFHHYHQMDVNPLKSLASRGICTDQLFPIFHHQPLLSMVNRRVRVGAVNVGDQPLSLFRKNVFAGIVSRIAHAGFYDKLNRTVMVCLSERGSDLPEPPGRKDGLLCVLPMGYSSVFQCWTMHAGRN